MMQTTAKTRWLGILTALLLMLTCIAAAFPQSILASAVSTDYATQLVRISTYDNSRNLNISGYGDKSPLNTWTTNGEQNENWRFDYVGTNSVGSFFKITNMGTGRLLTPMGYDVSEGTSCVIYGSESDLTQHWYVTAVEQDSLGNGLYYKITNYSDPDLALTYHADTNTITLSAYTGSSAQKWLLNTAGLQGFAGYCTDMDGNPKASTIGGLLGETVEVTTFDELQAACSDATPRTIVITKDISKTGTYTLDSNGRYRFTDARIFVYPNKTIIGSYAAHSLYNVYFQTYEGGYGQGNNIIIRNIEISHDKELNNDNIWEFSYGWNFWIDHCTFVGHSGLNTASTGQDDWDKFLNFKGTTDFITISDCQFGLHEYGVLLGYPTDTQETYDTYNGAPCVTLFDNYYKDTLTRAPALMRYGYFHSFNNYVVNFDMGYTIYTASKVYSENNYFEAGTGKGSIINDGTSTSDISYKYPGTFTDSGSVNVANPSWNFTLVAKNAQACAWRPNTNYTYTAKAAADIKAYCTANAGAKGSRSTMSYASYLQEGVPSAGYVEAPTEPWDSVPDVPSQVKGDVNGDDVLSVADVVMLQKYILAVGTLTDAKAADVYEDGIIDVFDLVILKRMLLADKTEPPTEPTQPTEPAPTEPETSPYEPEGFKFSGKVYLVGDSTVCDYDTATQQNLDRYGWGMKLAEQYTNVTVTNLALSGRSSRSFLEEQNYQTLCSSIGAGDYLFIQFGHNDEKTDEATYPGLGTYPGLDWSTLDSSGKNAQGQYSYEWILAAKYINVAKNAGAIPVLVTPITRRSTDGTPYYQAHTEYQQGMIGIAQMYGIPVIDATTLTTDLYNQTGAENTASFHCWIDDAHTEIDNTHLSGKGASAVASIIAEQTKELGLTLGSYAK